MDVTVLISDTSRPAKEVDQQPIEGGTLYLLECKDDGDTLLVSAVKTSAEGVFEMTGMVRIHGVAGITTEQGRCILGFPAIKKAQT